MSGIVPPPVRASLAEPGRGLQAVADPVPAHPGLEVAERRGREPARDQLQDALERLGREVAIGVGPADQVEEGGDVPGLDRHAGDDLLGEDVEAVGRHPERLDLVGDHRPGQSAADSSRSAWVLAIIRPLLTRPTTCPARPTRWSPRATPPGEPTWQTRSTAPMSIPSSSEAVATTLGNSPRFRASSVSRRSSWLRLPWCDSGDDPSRRIRVVQGRFRLGQLVEVAGEPLDDPAVVGEDDRRAVLRDQVEQPALDRRPDRPFEAGRRPAERGDHAEVEILAPAGVDDRHRPRLEPRRPFPGTTRTAEIAGDLLEGPLGGREADPDEAAGLSRLEPFEQERQEDPPLVRAEGVDLVDDDMRERAEGRSCPTREHQVQRFGRRDQDVGRLAEQPLAILRRGVAGPDRDRSTGAGASPLASAASRIPSRGTWRLRKMSLLSAFSGET